MKFNVTGMSCAACQARVEKSVSSLSGVEECSVNLLSSTLVVKGNISEEEVVSAVVSAGYGAARIDTKTAENANNSSQKTEFNSVLRRFILSLTLLSVLMYISMGHTMLGLPLPLLLQQSPVVIGLCELVLSGVILLINRGYFIRGAKAIWHRAPSMDTLVALGSGASYVYSLGAMIAMCIFPDDAVYYLHGLYFESAAMILVLVTLGKMLEARAKGKTRDAIRSLASLAPSVATIIVDGEERIVPTAEVRVGDVFAVKPGESVPVDGEILRGEGALIEAALTGESVPKDKSVGDQVYAATVNTSGYLVCRAVKVGDDTVLSSVIRMVDDAASSKAPIAKIADKVSGIFVPFVMGIGLVAFVIWLAVGSGIGYALARGISVLVISCPCALGLATPVAITVGSGVGARLGILYKSAEALEATARVRTVALDKTGTLTEGKPTVTDVHAVGIEENELLSIAGGVEKFSEHPLALAITEYASERCELAMAEDFRSLAGAGVSARVGEDEILGGSYKFISQFTNLGDDVIAARERLASEGKTPVFFTRGGDLIGYFAIRDSIREDAHAAARELSELGVRVVMLTGDNAVTARAIAKDIGIKAENVYAELMPEDKARLVSKLSSEGGVMMIGDGINDAPALVAADVGVAIGQGTDIAIDSADIVLMSASLASVPTAVRLGKSVLRNIKQNLFWAFIYNTLGIPLAAGLFIPIFGWELSPMFGALAMSLSSVTVVSNALRLGLFPRSVMKRANGKVETVEATTLAFEDTNEEENENMQITLKIEGMMCPHCEGRVKRALEAVPGVTSADVSHVKGEAVVACSADVLRDTLVKTVTDAGYDVVG